MSENLEEHVVGLRRELNKLTAKFVDDNFNSMNALMVGLEGIKKEIDSLDAFVVHRHNKRCLSILRKKMSQYFNEEETKTLMHDMGISEFEYTGNTLTGFHTELIGFCERRGVLSLLMDTLRLHRSRVQWPEC